MKKPTVLLERFYDDENKYEISIDEAGRGCLFGRVYIACVVLPKDSTKFDGTNIKDSKSIARSTPPPITIPLPTITRIIASPKYLIIFIFLFSFETITYQFRYSIAQECRTIKL